MKRTFLKTLGALMAVASLGGNAGATMAPAQNQATQREAINQRIQAPRPVSIRNDFSGGDNPFKYYRKGPRNQKQYRAFMRSNPNFPAYKKRK